MVAGKLSQPTSRDEFEIAIVCSRALEYNAVCLLLDKFWDTDGDPFGRARGDPNIYTTGCMGKYNIVVVLLCNSGKATAAGAAASLRSSYPSLELLLLTGICEGVPDANGEELLLGDVVISETVIQYDFGTQFALAFKEKDTLEDRQGRANKNIRSFTANIKTEMGYQRLERMVALYLEQIQSHASQKKHPRRRNAATYIYPGSANDMLFKSTHCHRHYNSSQCVCADYDPHEDFYAVCDESKDMNCEQTGCELSSLEPRDRLHQKKMLENEGDLTSAQIPSIFFGRFGSGDTAFSSGFHRDALAKKHRIIAFEMEGAGIWDELPCIIVKGVSDYGDGHKTKSWAEWQNFAAATAASVARALVERYPQTDKSPATDIKLQENKACLNALFITNPEDDKKRIEETKGGLLQDAYIWILRSKEFKQWFEDPETRLLWIKGDPGKGKTMLLCGIINELKATTSGRSVFYFFCQATNKHLNNAAAILRGLLHMIVVQQPALVSYIRYEYDKSGKSAFEGTNSWVVLSRIFEHMLRDESLKELNFIVDALDECLSDLAQLLEVIVQSSSSSSRIKWLVSSRNEADIQEALAAAANKSTVSLELNARSVSTAITTYIRHKVRFLSRKRRYKRSTRDDIERYLRDNANGTFLWVALVCALLEKTPRSDPLPKSAEFPTGLDELYERMLSKVCTLSSPSDLGRRVLAIATLARQPLTQQEFVSLIKNYDKNDDDDEDGTNPETYIWEEILGYCGSFLTMRNRTIYFIHQSAKDFILKHALQRLFPDGTECVHREILEASISAMRNALGKDMYGLVDPAFSIDNLSRHTLRNDPLIHIRYCCLYWIDHYEQSIPRCEVDDGGNLNIQELIYTFLQEKYVYWLEALSLLRSIFDGMTGMQRLEQSLVNTQVSGLPRLAWDARRFIQTFATGIADFPLQVYVSALAFSPTGSITRQLFRNEAPEWIQSLPAGEVEWAPSSRAYEGNKRIDYLTASHCGTWVASIFIDATITIWETTSGKISRILDACPMIPLIERKTDVDASKFTAVICFSPWNGKELASRWFKDQHVMISDVTTGKVSQQFRIEGDFISSSYITTARNTLGCLYYCWTDKKLVALIWNTETGQTIKSFSLKTFYFSNDFLTFSPTDEMKIARRWGVRSLHADILNFNSGRTVRTAEYGKDFHVKAIKFSPDGSLLAVAAVSSNVTGVITILDTTSGGTKWTFRYAVDGDTNSQSRFTFSADGRLLAVAAIGGIHVFNATTGACLHKVMMKSGCLIFSHDGMKIFSANGSMISVVDLGKENSSILGAESDSLEGQIMKRERVAISPDGRLVASLFSEPLTLEVLDIASRTSTNLLKHTTLGKYDGYAQILFSPDSKKLVSVLNIMAILWDVSSKPTKIFTWKYSLFDFGLSSGAFAFSSDSERVATTLYGGGTPMDGLMLKVMVWDIPSRKRLMYLGKRGPVSNVNLCFSPDGRRLAASWFDGDRRDIRVEIWDIASTSAIQVIKLKYSGLNPHFHVSTLDPDSRSSSNGENQENEETQEEEREDEKKNAECDICKLSFFDEDYMIIDVIKSLKPIRVALRTRTDLELTDDTRNNLRTKKAKSYDIDPTGIWIELHGRRLIWVPPQYRNQPADAQRNCLALSRDDGPLSILRFRHDILANQTSLPGTSLGEHTPPSPEMEVYTYLRELDDEWEVQHYDMKAPDDDMLDDIDSVGAAQYTLEIARQKAGQKVSETYWHWERKMGVGLVKLTFKCVRFFA